MKTCSSEDPPSPTSPSPRLSESPSADKFSSILELVCPPCRDLEDRRLTRASKYYRHLLLLVGHQSALANIPYILGEVNAIACYAIFTFLLPYYYWTSGSPSTKHFWHSLRMVPCLVATTRHEDSGLASVPIDSSVSHQGRCLRNLIMGYYLKGLMYYKR